jgi:hypothetical protein
MTAKIINMNKILFKFDWSDDGVWWTRSYKDERVEHWFRIGRTHFEDIIIYEFILWKLLIVWGIRK